MARIRSIKPEFPQSESMGRVSREARLCFVLLWTLSDDAGRLRGNPKMLASLLYPYDDDAAELMPGWLQELEENDCIVRYEVGASSYVQICAWLEHQKIDKPSASKIPSPPGSFENVREAAPPDQGEEGIKDQGEEGGEPSPPPVISLTLVDKSEFPITEAMLADFRASYPAVDVMQELREMRTWCNANPTKRKTHRGVLSFVTRWLGKEQDKGGRVAHYGQAPPPSRHTETAEETTARMAAANQGTKPMPAEIRQLAAQLTGRKAA